MDSPPGIDAFRIAKARPGIWEMVLVLVKNWLRLWLWNEAAVNKQKLFFVRLYLVLLLFNSHFRSKSTPLELGWGLHITEIKSPPDFRVQMAVADGVFFC